MYDEEEHVFYSLCEAHMVGEEIMQSNCWNIGCIVSDRKAAQKYMRMSSTASGCAGYSVSVPSSQCMAS